MTLGYIMGTGDEVPDGLRRLGVPVTLLTPAEVASGDLSRYDVIMVGVRASEVRPDYVANHARLLDYVRAGGTMIVQYNKYEFTEPGIAPYRVAMARPHGRVTDANAAVRVLAPQHRLLSWPNRIGPRDFEGWVQERGLNFPTSSVGSSILFPFGEPLYLPCLQDHPLRLSPVRHSTCPETRAAGRSDRLLPLRTLSSRIIERGGS